MQIDQHKKQTPTLNVEVTTPFKYLGNFQRFHYLTLLNGEVPLALSQAKNSVLIEQHNNATEVNFMITCTKLYFPVITLSINDNIKLLENIKQGFKRTISLNKYRSEITIQSKNINLDYLIDPTFRNINRLYVISFKNGNDDPTTNSFDQYYIPLVEIIDFNVLIDNKPFFGQPVKNKQGAYEKLVEILRNDDYKIGNLLDYLYHLNHYKLKSIDLSRQTTTSISQKINFTKRLEKDNDVTIFFFIVEKQQKSILIFPLYSLIIIE